MRIWRLHIMWQGRDESIVRRKKPGKRTKKAPLRTPEEINTMITDMGKPRHTPEELDRLVVREENTPIKERISPVEE